MLKLAAASGTTDLVATPHVNAEFPFDEGRLEEAFRELSRRSAGIVNLHYGCDFHLNTQNLQDALLHPTRYTINHGPYLLVELPDFLGLSVIREQLQTLINARIHPIITHPERNVSLQSATDRLKQWIADGCLVQVTAQSFLGRFGRTSRRIAESLMNAGLVHFIASDAHDCTDRTPNLSEAYQHICNGWGKTRAQILFIDNPAAALSGHPVQRDFQGTGWPLRFLSFWKQTDRKKA